MTVIWLLATIVGFAHLHAYANTPFPIRGTASSWPAHSRLTAGLDKPTVVVFLHPYCPCSKATVSALQELADHYGSSVQFDAVFVRPKGVGAGWEHSDLYATCRQDKAITTFVDDLGVEAKDFGAMASGQAYVFDAHGQIALAGGLTPARGEVWTDRQRDLIVEALQGHRGIRTPTFGCALL